MKLINGEHKIIDLSEKIVESHFTNSTNCTNEILSQIENDFYKEFIDENDDVIFDLGANVGLFSLYVSPYAKKIISLEPTPNHFKILNILTKDCNNIKTCNAAIGNSNEYVDFHLSESNTTMNSLVNNNYSNSIKVKSYTLKELMRITHTSKIDFLKIDIEGSEILFLNDENINTMKENVNKFFIEFHDSFNQSYSQHRFNYKNIFENVGFKCQEISVDALFCYKP